MIYDLCLINDLRNDDIEFNVDNCFSKSASDSSPRAKLISIKAAFSFLVNGLS